MKKKNACNGQYKPLDRYNPNLGFEIAVFARERERGRFRGSIKEAGGALREHCEGARGSIMGQCRGAVDGNLKWLPQFRLELPS